DAFWFRAPPIVYDGFYARRGQADGLAPAGEVPFVMSDEDGKSSDLPGAPPSRDAQLPHAPPASQPGSSPGSDRRTSTGTVMMMRGADGRTSSPAGERSSQPARTSRGTLLMSRPPGVRRPSRTTIMEVNEIAQRLSILRPAGAEQNPLRQMAIAFAMSVT